MTLASLKFAPALVELLIALPRFASASARAATGSSRLVTSHPATLSAGPVRVHPCQYALRGLESCRPTPPRGCAKWLDIDIARENKHSPADSSRSCLTTPGQA